jgi:hypothetical protein
MRKLRPVYLEPPSGDDERIPVEPSASSTGPQQRRNGPGDPPPPAGSEQSPPCRMPICCKSTMLLGPRQPEVANADHGQCPPPSHPIRTVCATRLLNVNVLAGPGSLVPSSPGAGAGPVAQLAQRGRRQVLSGVVRAGARRDPEDRQFRGAHLDHRLPRHATRASPEGRRCSSAASPGTTPPSWPGRQQRHPLLGPARVNSPQSVEDRHYDQADETAN